VNAGRRKFEILREVSFGFTEDRLLHLQGADVSRWTDDCTAELRREIASAAPPRIDISLLDFPELRCLSLQCRSLPITNP